MFLNLFWVLSFFVREIKMKKEEKRKKFRTFVVGEWDPMWIEINETSMLQFYKGCVVFWYSISESQVSVFFIFFTLSFNLGQIWFSIKNNKSESSSCVVMFVAFGKAVFYYFVR